MTKKEQTPNRIIVKKKRTKVEKRPCARTTTKIGDTFDEKAQQ